MVLVKLMQPGKAIVEFDVSSEPKLSKLLALANLPYISGSAIRRHEDLDRYETLYDGDVITYATPTKGNQMFEVKVIIIGSNNPIVSLPADDGMTIDAVLAQLPSEQRAKIMSADGKPIYEYRIGDSEALSGSHVLSRPASGSVRLVLSTRTKGNE